MAESQPIIRWRNVETDAARSPEARLLRLRDQPLHLVGEPERHVELREL